MDTGRRAIIAGDGHLDRSVSVQFRGNHYPRGARAKLGA